MNHALVLSIFSSTFLVLSTVSGTTGDTGPQFPSAVQDDRSLLQTQAQPQSALMSEGEGEKRYLRDLHNSWGKRGWKDLQSTGWGKRSLEDLRIGWEERDRSDFQNPLDKKAWSDLRGGSWGKRDWSQFRGGWGKRYSSDKLANLYDNQETLEDEEDDIDEDLLENGKSTRINLTGMWGKRDPGWNNLRGMWGKRDDSKWARLQGSWGKRSVGGPARMKPAEVRE